MRKLLSLAVLVTAAALSVATSELPPETTPVLQVTDRVSVAATHTEAGWDVEVRVCDVEAD